MFPLIRFVAIFGGVSAGCQLASGVVRGVKELCRGRPVAGLMEVADGMAAPILTAVTEVSRLGKEVYDAVRSPWEEGLNDVAKLTPAEQPKHCGQVPASEDASANTRAS